MTHAVHIADGALIDGTGAAPRLNTDVVTVVADARISGVPDERFPVCEDNGDDVCVAPSGEVVFWSRNGVTDERWADLAAWIMDVRIGES